MPLIQPLVAQRGLDTGGVPNTARDDSIGQGLRQLGGAVANAGDVQARIQQIGEQRARFASNQELRVADARIETKVAELVAGMDPSDPKFGTGGSFIAEVNSFVQGEYERIFDQAPATLKPELGAQISASTTVWEQHAAKAVSEGLQGWYSDSVDKEIDAAKTTVFGNPGNLQGAIVDIDQMIDSSGLYAGAAAAKKRAARVALEASAAGREVIDDPSALQSKLGIATPSNAAALIRAEEGFRSSAYADTVASTGKFSAWRAGYGSDTYTDENGKVHKVRQGTRISAADAERDLERRLGDFEATAKGQVGEAAWNKLPDAARTGLLSVVYNYGRLPTSVANAIGSGDVEKIAASVERLSANPERRAREAAVIRGGAMPAPEYGDLPFDTRRELYDRAAAQNRAQIDIAVTNAPAAIQSTGKYDGVSPLPGDFIAAYGPQEGAQRYSAYAASVDVAKAAYDMRTMSPAEIAAAVDSAKPTASGDSAALDAKRYDALSAAAVETMKARNADPAAYTSSVFSEVAQAWDAAQPKIETDPTTNLPKPVQAAPGAYAHAIAVTMAAQEKLGITNPVPLPSTMADAAVTSWASVDKPEVARWADVADLILQAKTPEAQRAVFNQLVAAGIPSAAGGAVDALVRGDMGAARRLFQAAMIDPSKLPAKLGTDFSAEKIKEAAQSTLFAPGGVGDIFYGLSNGDASNFARAAADTELIVNSAQLRMLEGRTLDEAVRAVGKDLFGDVVPVTGQNVSVLVDVGTDQHALQVGFGQLLPQVRDALSASSAVPPGASVADSSKAIFAGVEAQHREDILAEGYFRNAGDGFQFIDPFDGTAVEGADGKPLTFTLDQVMKAAGSAPPRVDPTPDLMDAERAWLEQQASTFRSAGP